MNGFGEPPACSPSRDLPRSGWPLTLFVLPTGGGARSLSKCPDPDSDSDLLVQPLSHTGPGKAGASYDVELSRFPRKPGQRGLWWGSTELHAAVTWSKDIDHSLVRPHGQAVVGNLPQRWHFCSDGESANRPSLSERPLADVCSGFQHISEI